MADSSNSNGEINKNWIALFGAFCMIWFGVSFLLPFTSIDIDYNKILIEERVFNRWSLGDGISDFIIVLHDKIDEGVKHSFIWHAVINASNHYANSVVVQEGVKILAAQVSLITYRLAAIISLMVFFLPFGIALVLDAFWFREIGKWRFFQPSPTIHRTGQISGSFALIGSFVILMAIPFFVVPIIFILIGVLISYVGFWLWIAHTQKRI
jgi:hypothetical protein